MQLAQRSRAVLRRWLLVLSEMRAGAERFAGSRGPSGTFVLPDWSRWQSDAPFLSYPLNTANSASTLNKDLAKYLSKLNKRIRTYSPQNAAQSIGLSEKIHVLGTASVDTNP